MSGRLWSFASSPCADEPRQDRQSLAHRQAPGGRREVEPHDGRGVGLRQFGQPAQQGRIGGFGPIEGELDRPGADVGAGVVEPLRDAGVVQAAGRVQGPEAAQASRLIGVAEGDPGEGLVDFRLRPALLEDAAGVADVPLVAVELQRDEFRVGRAS